MYVSDHGGLLRARNGGEQQVTPFELFFDLVFVFAVTQLSHRLLEHLTMVGTLQTLLLLLVVWSAWVTTTWVTNWFDPNQLWVRLMLVTVMLASLFMSVAIPEAFGERGLMFALAYVAMQVGRAAFAFVTPERLFGCVSSAEQDLPADTYLACGGGGAVDSWRCAGRRGAVRAVGHRSGHSLRRPDDWLLRTGSWTLRTSEWPVEGGHFAERCRLFVIIVLGESLLVTGTTFGRIEVSKANITAFVVAFLGSVALWWIYFQRSEEAAHATISSSEDPGRLARSAYTYFHLPMIAGILAFAAADELTVAHPGEHGTPTSIVLTLGGLALFLAGHALFEWAVFGVLSGRTWWPSPCWQC